MTAKMVEIKANYPKWEGKSMVMNRKSVGATTSKAILTGQKVGGTGFNVL